MSQYIQWLSVQAHQRELNAEREARRLVKLATARERPRLRLNLLRRPRPDPCESWQPCPDAVAP